MRNVDDLTVLGFGDEWGTYRQQNPEELRAAFDQYFCVFPWHLIGLGSEGFDMGCGSGRWARFVAPRVGRLNCIDPSLQALGTARSNLAEFDNCSFEQAIVEDCSLLDESQDFGYCLGVLHHIPDARSAMRACVRKLKPGAPFLVYLYYRFDNKPFLFRVAWSVSDLLRRVICRLPFLFKLPVTRAIAAIVYFPLARLSLCLERLGLDVSHVPLSDYRRKSFYIMQTDALDRFGTRLEQRFTRSEIYSMMSDCGLESIVFSGSTPYWVALGYRANG